MQTLQSRTKNITEIKIAEFTQIGATIAGDLMIQGDAGGLEYNVPTGLNHSFRVQDVPHLTIDVNSVSVVGSATSLLLPEFLIFSATLK